MSPRGIVYPLSLNMNWHVNNCTNVADISIKLCGLTIIFLLQVKETVQQCTCADNPFPVEKIADGKYTIGENRVLIFVRVSKGCGFRLVYRTTDMIGEDRHYIDRHYWRGILVFIGKSSTTYSLFRHSYWRTWFGSSIKIQ